jgi:hypothetical protein
MLCHLQGKLEREQLHLLKLTARRMKARRWGDFADRVVNHQPEELWLWKPGISKDKNTPSASELGRGCPIQRKRNGEITKVADWKEPK